MGNCRQAPDGPAKAVPARSEIGNLEVQNRQRQTVLIRSLGAADLGLRLLQLRLAQFHDGGQAELVARLGQLERQVAITQYKGSVWKRDLLN